MEELKNLETDFRKWLVFSQVITSAAKIEEFEKAVSKKKSFKSIEVLTEKGDAKQYRIKEKENPSVLLVDENSIIELKSYFVNTYKPSKKEPTRLSKGNMHQHSSLTRDSSFNKYLYSKSSFGHALKFAFYTLLGLQVFLIPKFIMGMELPFGNFVRYSICLIGLFYCLKYYKQHQKPEPGFVDIYLVCWLFTSLVFFLFFSEVTLLSIPAEVPSVTWTSMVYIGTLVLGSFYLLILSLLPAIIFRLLMRFI